jgi:membrane protease YdiL (CAAX protease family)
MSTGTTPVRIIGLMLWTLLPIGAMWLGLYQIKSAAWTFVLYHGICLVPTIIWGRSLWRPGILRPSLKECLVLVLAAIAFSCLALLLYELAGNKLLSSEQALDLLREQGYSKTMFWVLSVYAVVVNPVLEELFWRGVVFSELDKVKKPFKHFGITWSSISYAGFHYLIFRLVLFPGFAELGILMLAGYGAFLALVYRKTGSIVTTAMAHGLLTDLAAIVLMLDLFRRYPNYL